MNTPQSGPREPWRTLGTPVVLLAVLAVGICALAGVALVTGLAWLGDQWRRIERWVLGAVMGALAALICVQAIGQQMGLGITWTEEICVIAVAIAVWLGLPMLLAGGEMLSVEAGPLARWPMARWITGAATVIFLLALFVLAWRAMPPWALQTPTLHIPRRLLWMLLPLAIILSAAAHVSVSGDRHPRFTPASVKKTK
ncbi:TRAP transporter small permease subunit [Candidatus Sumerlaeota bacterium]|nr:TRAP transporter small permease subunit [Candidatus Sumerlaeota bacterium]